MEKFKPKNPLKTVLLVVKDNEEELDRVIVHLVGLQADQFTCENPGDRQREESDVECRHTSKQ